jgi:hypothetical protein
MTFQPSHTFAGPNPEKILATSVGQGNYAFVATVRLTGSVPNCSTSSCDSMVFDVACTLQDGATVIGTASAQSESSGDHAGFEPKETLTLIGVRAVGSSGTEISLWCSNAGTPTGSLSTGADLLTLTVGSFF